METHLVIHRAPGFIELRVRFLLCTRRTIWVRPFFCHRFVTALLFARLVTSPQIVG